MNLISSCKMFLKRLRSFVKGITKARVSRTLCSCFIFAFFVPCLFFFAVCCYALFYYSYVPVLFTEVNLNFLIRGDLFREAIVDFDYLEYEPLDPRVRYSIDLEVDLPESPTNKELGMLVVGLKMHSRVHNTSHEEIFKSTLLEYKSSLHYHLETLFTLPLLLLTHRKQMQTLTLSMTDKFFEAYPHSSTEAVVTVYHPHVQLYGGRLRFCALFSGVRYLLYHWWMTSAIFGVLVLFSCFLLAAFSVWLFYFIFWVVRRKECVSESGKNSEREEDGNRKRVKEENRKKEIRKEIGSRKEEVVDRKEKEKEEEEEDVRSKSLLVSTATRNVPTTSAEEEKEPVTSSTSSRSVTAVDENKKHI